MDLRLYEYRIPLRAPLAPGASVLRERNGLLVAWDRGEKGVVWGEAAPLPGYSPDSFDEAASQLERAVVHLREASFAPERIRREVRAMTAPSAQCALDMLLWDAKPRVERIAVSALLADDAERRAAVLREAGYKTAKLKVGRGDLEEEIERVRAISAILGDRVRLRLDANRAWEPDEAIYFGSRIADCPIDYIEEPLRDATRLPEWSSPPIALDETLREIHPDALARCGPVKAVVIKPTCLGGDRAREWAVAARRAGLQVVAGAACESGIGLRHLARWAAAWGSPEVAHGLDTARHFADDAIEPRMALEGPEIVWRDLFADPYHVNVNRLKRRL